MTHPPDNTTPVDNAGVFTATNSLQPNLFDLNDGPPGALVVQRVNHETARIPCEQWHYAGMMPSSFSYTYGVWESGRYRGALLFGNTVASNGHTLIVGMVPQQVKELLRIALNGHDAPLTRIISMALALFKRDAPEVELLISYADPDVGHHGGIYQAASWIYVGKSARKRVYVVKGERLHNRTVRHRWATEDMEWIRRYVDPDATQRLLPPKHKYAFGLNRRVKKQLATMALPYPKGNSWSINADLFEGEELEPWQMGMGAEWNGHADGFATDIYQGDTEKIVATAFDDDVIVRPNAAMIVATRDLLAALKCARETIAMWHGPMAWTEYKQSPEMQMIDAAIAKARGGTAQ